MFEIKHEDGLARSGILSTPHGKVEMPNFKPVATKAAVKYISTQELEEMGTSSIISNAFILYLRPGLEIIRNHGGLHRFMNWNKTIFTDNGGFQVFSLEKDYHMDITSKGLIFRSPFDGSKHVITPEKTIEIAHTLGSDVAMALDHMPLAGCSRQEAIKSLKHTHAWADECKKLHDNLYKNENNKQLLFGIAQGSVFKDLREKSVKFIDKLNFDGIAFGGLAIGEPWDKTKEMIKLSSLNCSKAKPRYVMGLGSPAEILEAIALGVDTFDSVYPTRNARHGQLFTLDGHINIENSCFRDDLSPIDANCKCDVCKRYSRAYIHHLFRTRERLGMRLASYHNLYFMQNLMKEVRKAIKDNEFNEFKENFLNRYYNNAIKK